MLEQPISLVQPLAQGVGDALALYNFDGESEGELPMKKGDRLAVIGEVGATWTLACVPETGETGYVPSMFLVVLDAAGRGVS